MIAAVFHILGLEHLGESALALLSYETVLSHGLGIWKGVVEEINLRDGN